MKYNTIIIGGGLAGLTAGATLSKFGKKVLLLEQHHKPGGCATTFKRKDFIIEVGLHEMSGIIEGGTIKTIFNLLDVEKHVEFKKVPEFYGVLSDKEDFVLPHGYEAATRALTNKYPEEEKVIKKFMKVLKGVRKEGTSLPRSPLVRKLIYPLIPLLYPNLVTATKHTVGSWMDKYIKSEELKLDLTAHVAYWGDDPYTLSLFYFALPFAGFIENGGHFIKGGSQKLSNHLAEFIEKHGGTILLGKKVEKIITENNKATGVIFNDVFSKEAEPVTITCDNVIANAAIPTIPAMLDEPYASKLQEKIEEHPDSTSLLCMYFGFNQKVDKFGVKYYSNFIKGKDVNTLKDVHPNQLGDWNKRSFIFVDYEKVDAGLAPADKAAGVICAVDYLKDWENLSDEAYKSEKEEVAQILLRRLEEKFPGIGATVEYYEISTPKTIKRYTSNPSGAVYGFAQTLQLTASKRFRNNFLIPNLYFASAWAFPGGGFEGSIMGGFLAALQMNKDKIWSVIDEEKYSDDRIVKFKSSKKLDKNTVELSFEKPEGFKNEKGQYAILNLKDPKEMKLDLPYRWLPIDSNGNDEELSFKIKMDNSSFSKSCEKLEVGDKAIVFGPMV